MRDRTVIRIENYTIYYGDDDENKVGGCVIDVKNDYKKLVEEFGSTSSRCAFPQLRDRRGRELLIISAHALTETAEDKQAGSHCRNQCKCEDETRTAIRCARKMALPSGAQVGVRTRKKLNDTDFFTKCIKDALSVWIRQSQTLPCGHNKCYAHLPVPESKHKSLGPGEI